MADARHSPHSPSEIKLEGISLDLKIALKNLSIKFSEYKEWHQLAMQNKEKFKLLQTLFQEQQKHLISLHSFPSKLLAKIEASLESAENFINLDQLLLDANSKFEELRNFKTVCIRSITNVLEDVHIFKKLVMKKMHLIDELTLSDLDEYFTHMMEITNLDENGKNVKELFSIYFKKESEGAYEVFKEKYIHLETVSITRDAIECEGEIDAVRNSVKHLPQLAEELEKINQSISELSHIISNQERQRAEAEAREAREAKAYEERQRAEAEARVAKAHLDKAIRTKEEKVPEHGVGANLPAINLHEAKENKSPAEKKLDYEACVSLISDVLSHNDKLWKMSKKNFLASSIWKEPSTITDFKKVLNKHIPPLTKLQQIADILLNSEHGKILVVKEKKEKSSATRELSLDDLVKYKMKPRFQLYIVLHRALQSISAKQPPLPEVIYANLIEGFNRIETRIGLWKTHLASFEDVRKRPS